MPPPHPPPPPLYRTNEVIILGVLGLLLVLSAFLFTWGVANRYLAVNAYTFTWIGHRRTRGLKGGSKRGELNSPGGVKSFLQLFHPLQWKVLFGLSPTKPLNLLCRSALSEKTIMTHSSDSFVIQCVGFCLSPNHVFVSIHQGMYFINRFETFMTLISALAWNWEKRGLQKGSWEMWFFGTVSTGVG